jgi:hypothetical protein
MLYCIDTKKEVDFDEFFNAVENGEIVIDSRNWTEKDSEEVRMAIKEHKTLKQKNNVGKELVFA